MQIHDEIIARYRRRVERFAAERDRLESRSRRIARIRVGLFVLALAALVRAELVAAGRGAFLGIGIALLVGFIALVVYHGRIKRAQRRVAALAAVNEEGPLRIAREWDRLPGADFGTSDPSHAYAIDLDIFGRASLFHLLGGTVGTAPGRSTLGSWLLGPALPGEVRARQEAVAELAPMDDLRDEIAVRGRLKRRSRPEDVERFLEWAEDEPWLLGRPAVIWSARLLAIANLALVAADVFGWIQPPLWILTVLAGIALTWALRDRVYGTFSRAFAREGAFREYAGLFRLLADAPWSAPRLVAIQSALAPGGEPAHRQMRRLERIMELSDLRLSGMFHFPIHALTLWDFHVLQALERWQLASGSKARAWIRALGEAEALCALATLAHDQPEWAVPWLDEPGAVDGADAADSAHVAGPTSEPGATAGVGDSDQPPALLAESLGHPLLPPDVRVDNDVTVGPPGTVLLVTGSNMSGKSTLLRAIGTNVVLAQAGGPVCARALRLPPLALWTSMRVQDSLSRGVSYFMAELQRLKQVIDAARDARRGDRTLLYLLDEILHGTNTAERQIAAQRVISFLVESGAIGAVSTHDLALAAAPGLDDALHLVHFTERVGRENGRMTMRFDYELREGAATSTNALKLMEIVGLELGQHR